MTNFYLDTRPDKNGECPIRVSIRTGGRRFMTSIGYNISPENWNKNTRLVRVGTKNNPVFNAKGVPAATINARIAAITAAFAKIEAIPGAASVEAFQAALNKITGRVPKATKGLQDKAALSSDMLAAFDQFVLEEGAANQWTAGTREHLQAFRLHLINFRKNPTFSDFDEKGLVRFIDYLRNRAISDVKAAKVSNEKAQAEAALKAAKSEGAEERAKAAIIKANAQIEEFRQEPEGLAEITVQKHYNNLKWLLRWAIRKGYCDCRDIEKYRPKFKLTAKPVIFLTQNELLRLYNFEIPANGTKVMLKDANGLEYEKVVQEAGALAKTRDLFCFCAFTSLRYSDMAALKRSNISGDKIIITTKKTHDLLEIPLNDYSRAILDKYADLFDPRGLALPVITNQKMNYYLKDLCELCGFNELISRAYYRGGERVEETAPKWQLISTHAARRTFICYAVTIGISPHIIMKWTGHSDYDAMKPYIDVAGADAAKAMQLFNKMT